MTLVYLLQMVPGKTGNLLHEAAGLVFALLFVVHHVLNRGWLRRLGRQRNLRARATLASDVVLTVCVVGVALTGVLMSRSVLPWLSVPAVAHAVRPLHGSCAYLGLMTTALHVGLHLRVMRGYAGQRGAQSDGFSWHDAAVVSMAFVLGSWAFVRLGVADKLLGKLSFPDGMTPLVLQLVWHLALAAPFVGVGACIDNAAQGRSGAPAVRRDKKGPNHV